MKPKKSKEIICLMCGKKFPEEETQTLFCSSDFCIEFFCMHFCHDCGYKLADILESIIDVIRRTGK